MCKAIDKNIVCCLPAYPRKLAFWLLLSELILGRFFQIFFTWVKGGRVRLRCTLGKCQCRGVLLFFYNCRAHCACSRCWWGCSIISLFPYRLKYYLKGPLKAKQQHKFNFNYSLTEFKLPVKDGKQYWP